MTRPSTRTLVNRLVIAGALLTFLIVGIETGVNILYFSRMFHQFERTPPQAGYVLHTEAPEYLNNGDSTVVSAFLTHPTGGNVKHVFIVKADSCEISAPAFDVQKVAASSQASACQWVLLSKYSGAQVAAVRVAFRSYALRSYLRIRVGDNPISLGHLAGVTGLVTALIALYFRFFGSSNSLPDFEPVEKKEPASV